MKTSKLIAATQTLSKEEWSSWMKHVLMQTSEKTDLYTLFLALKANKNGEIDSAILEKIRRKHFQDLPQKAFLNLQSKLYLWLEDWMTIEELKHDRYQSSLLLVKALNRRSLYKHANQVADKLEKKINSQKLNIENTKVLAQLKHSQYFSNNPIKYPEGIQLLQDIVNYHLSYFLEQNTLYKRELDNWGKIKKHDFSKEISAIENIEPYIQPTKISKIGNTLYKVATTGDVAGFMHLKSILINKKEIEPNSEFSTLITLYLIRDGFNLYQLKEISDRQIFIELYNEAFENGAFENHGKINPITFHNIIDVLSDLIDYDEIVAMISIWIDKVNYYDKDSTTNLALAQSAFKNEKYDEIIFYLRDLTKLTSEQKRRALGLNLIAHYHHRHNDYNTFINTLNNFKRYLKRHKNEIPIKIYRNNYNLSMSIEHLAKLDFSKQEKPIENKGVLYRGWIEKETLKQKANNT